MRACGVRVWSLLATLGAVAAGTVWEWQETGRVATVELQPYPGSDYVVQGTLALRELYAKPLYAVNITGLVSIEGECGEAGLHIHTGRDPFDANTVGGHLFAPDSVDPWESSTVRGGGRLAALIVMTTAVAPLLRRTPWVNGRGHTDRLQRIPQHGLKREYTCNPNPLERLLMTYQHSVSLLNP